RLQTLLVAFSFGALLEGIAGFGAPVAITASIMASLGFEPVTAAVLALLANTAPVAFGSIGIPITTLGGLVAPILGHTDAASTTHAPRPQPRPGMGASADLPGEAAATRAPAQKPASPLAAYFMYVVLVVVILIGQMGNLPGLTKLTTPTNLTADLKCGTPAF